MSSRSYRNNNPGNLDFTPFTKLCGGTLEIGVDKPRFAKFPTAAKGLTALARLLSGPSYINLSIKQALERYAPGNENNTKAYINFVCTKTGLNRDAFLSWFNAYQFINLLLAITEYEGYEE